MIRISVLTPQGARAGRALSAQFDVQGGTIGRAPANTLVLDDPDRTVSRVHAQVLCRDGQYFIVDRGSNPMLCNGRPLGAGNEAALSQGMRLVIGGFELVVEAAPSAASAGAAAALAAAPAAVARPAEDDPFADLLAGLGPAAPAPAAASAVPDLPLGDPLGAGRPAASAEDPFADLLAPSPAAPGVATPARGLLDDDFSDLGLVSPAAKGTGIDELFGGGAGAGLGGDPLALSPLADPLRQPNTAAAADPFAALQGTPPAAAAPRADHLPIGQFGYAPPREVPAVAPSSAPRFDDMTGEPVLASPPPGPASAPMGATSPDALLAALLRGLGSTHQMPELLTPGLMERIGVLLRSATEGTLQLLLTRQEFKRELRAEVTMIAAQANNPLKFSPTAEVALAHLLGPGVRGFMPAEAAMRDAFDDLRAHQFGVMVGMRAALAQLIERFEPGELEKKIAAKSALDSLFAANRKAKLWDQFVALYAGIASEAEDDFHTLFGKAFVQAYEEQMARLKSGEGRK
ncbi:type VI secretion system-associated FHA domain protein TagH [Variovorax sp. RA8]|uniref:type VI secretion system-associated FHA domain protein TagH n=1 Tax=Variovorax sp. (strain JCM 16519 / RA8) TaxID=662548 RepID=UPI001316032C|nr:type VI secretion system-associated FHA domain protein TagH [Variovorax sp. RA8]VTU36794.1 type VI secretion system FHA domain protein [Variovorax sp. RA8]